MVRSLQFRTPFTHVRDVCGKGAIVFKNRSLNWIVMLIMSVILTSCAMESLREDENDSMFTLEPAGLPVGFDRQAGMISFRKGIAYFDALDTRYPVLHFTGMNADRTMIAYTSLALPDNDRKGEFVDVDLMDAMVMPLMSLVPSGRLVLERPDGTTTTVTRKHSYIVAAAWHPTDPNRIGFSYMEGDRYGLSVFDVRTGIQEEVLQEDLTPELIVWSDDGNRLGAYRADPSLPHRELSAGHEGIYDIAHRWQYVAVSTSDRESDVGQPTFDHGSMSFVESSTLSQVAFEHGGVVTLPEGVSSGSAYFERDGEALVTELRTDQIRHVSRRGLAFVNYDESGMHLFATNGLEAPQLVALSGGMSINYYIPLHSSEGSYFTQVGSGYGGCNLWDHTGSMAYAVDLQIPTSNYDEVIASANGTISGGASGVTCNSLDTTGCAIYSSPCSSNGGWGNYVMIAHADGRYTFYGHLENTNYQVHMSGVSVSRGCWLADEGGTGYSIGNKNGCGDHMHFQWQTSGSRGAASVSGGFWETTLNSGSCGSHSPVTGIMSCSL